MTVPFPPKPPALCWVTYERLRAETLSAERGYLELQAKKIAERERRLIREFRHVLPLVTDDVADLAAKGTKQARRGRRPTSDT
jgi:hypothetical protein